MSPKVMLKMPGFSMTLRIHLDLHLQYEKASNKKSKAKSKAKAKQQKTLYTSRFVRVILVGYPCYSVLNQNGKQ